MLLYYYRCLCTTFLCFRKQRCCSPSCIWSQTQRDISDPDNFQNLGYWLTIRHRGMCMWNWTEMLIFFFPVESKDCMNSASYEYRNMSARRGAQFVPMGMPTICWKTSPPTKSSLKKFCGRYGRGSYQRIWISSLTNAKWHSVAWPNTMITLHRSDFIPNPWPFYRTRPCIDLRDVSIEHLRLV